MKIVLNHKCNFTKSEFLAYQEAFANMKTSHSLVLCPSTPYLSLFNLSNASLGCQDVSRYETGAHTGDVAASQLKALNTKYAIVGHSERRNNYQETEEVIKDKIEKLLSVGITPILCVGETKEERECGKTLEIITKELSILKESDKEKVIIAYEPIWAIGTGEIPTAAEIDEILESIRSKTKENTLLYGGSVSDENIEELKKSKYIEGYLLGGLSLKLEKLQVFLDLC